MTYHIVQALALAAALWLSGNYVGNLAVAIKEHSNVAVSKANISLRLSAIAWAIFWYMSWGH